MQLTSQQIRDLLDPAKPNYFDAVEKATHLFNRLNGRMPTANEYDTLCSNVARVADQEKIASQQQQADAYRKAKDPG